MSADRRASERGRWESQTRRLALVALLALVSSALLPFVHGSSSHGGDCGVCTAMTHNGASSAEAAPALVIASTTARPELAEIEPVGALPRPDFAVHPARAPPAAVIA